jgi:hypothetical protein
LPDADTPFWRRWLFWLAVVAVIVFVVVPLVATETLSPG